MFYGSTPLNNELTVNNQNNFSAPVSADENKVLHAVQTIGQLSTKTAHRVYHSVAAQLKTIKKEDVADYISSVVSILRLTQFINVGQKPICDKEEGPVGKKEDTS